MSTVLLTDSEFDEGTNQLLSLAIISGSGKYVFYEVLEHDLKGVDPWVVENVIPKFDRPAISKAKFQAKLEAYLSQFKTGVKIIANHPNDIYFFNLMLRKEKGDWIKVQPLTFAIRDDLSSKAASNLHNALSDTVAMREDWIVKGD